MPIIVTPGAAPSSLSHLLRHRVTLDRRDDSYDTGLGRDEYGLPDGDWTPLATEPGYMQPDGKTEILVGQETVFAAYRCYLEVSTVAREQDRLIWEDRTFEIIGVLRHDAPDRQVYAVAYLSEAS